MCSAFLSEGGVNLVKPWVMENHTLRTLNSLKGLIMPYIFVPIKWKDKWMSYACI